LAYVVPLGIPHSRFLEWDELDQDKALAWHREQATVCRGCGTRPAEWARDRFAYVGQTRYCPGCELLEQEKENVPETARGVTVHLTPRELAEDPEES
jgi:hypothetical protein